MPGYYWIDTVSGGYLPSTALQGGVDSDGHKIYVGRAFHANDWIPAKVIPDKRKAYIAYGGKEVVANNFQVLCEQIFDWIPCSGSNIPANAVKGGQTSDGETLYIGRALHEGSNTVGKVQPSHGVIYIPYAGKEYSYTKYEILILRK